MPRKGHIAKKDRRAGSCLWMDLVTKFVNSMMWQGKKSTAEASFYEALTACRPRWRRGLEAVQEGGSRMPSRWKVKSRRVGGATISAGGSECRRRTSLAIRCCDLLARTREKE